MKAYTQLSQGERYTITALLRRHVSISEIARHTGRHRSTIYRELNRNPNTHDDVYRAEVAHSYATARRRRNRRGTHYSKVQWSLVKYHLRKKWSPRQVSNHLKVHTSFRMSHETIYRAIRRDKKLGGSLYTYMRILPKLFRKSYGGRDYRGMLSGKRHISTRPAEVEAKLIRGHWEADTVIGSDKHHCILTLVERVSKLVIIMKLAHRTVEETNAALVQVIAKQPKRFKTITFDNGTEFHGYAVIEQLFPATTCYFATPYHSWERGLNENTNGLIRQYLPKGSSMAGVTQAHCDWIAEELNTRPRELMGFQTPKKVYYSRV